METNNNPKCEGCGKLWLGKHWGARYCTDCATGFEETDRAFSRMERPELESPRS